MEYRRLGSSGLKVSEVGLGSNQFGRRVDEQNSIAIINHAIDLGISFIDTADAYGQDINSTDKYGEKKSEVFVGKAVKNKRSQVIIATKFGSPMGPSINESGGSRHYIMKAVDASLRRLQTDYIDLYQIHRTDDTTPIEETLRALDDLVRAGKVRYIGCSNFAAWQLCEALWTSKVNNLQSFVTVQSRYSLLEREIEGELVSCCQTYGIGVIPYNPLAGGFLTGKYRKGDEQATEGRLSGPNVHEHFRGIFSEENWAKLAGLEAFATQHGHTVGELAIAWLLSRPWLSSVISGVTKKEQVSANVAAAEWKLTAAEAAEVDAI